MRKTNSHSNNPISRYKLLLVFVVLVFYCSSLQAQTEGDGGPAQNGNYILMSVPQVEGITTTSQLNALPIQQANQSINYFDGLGRLLQSTKISASPLKKDIVQPYQHDGAGRQAKKFLPYASKGAGGIYRPAALVGRFNVYAGSFQHDFYRVGLNNVASEDSAYARTIYDDSPLNRVLKEGRTGRLWMPDNQLLDVSVKHAYAANASEEVLLFQYNPTTESITCVNNGVPQYYAPSRLIKSTVLDELNYETIVYVDQEEKTILSKKQYRTNGTTKEYAETYYVYDAFGRLVTVFPPEAVNAIKKTLNR